MKRSSSNKLDVNALAQRTGASVPLVRRWVELGAPKLRDGRKIVFDLGAITQWLVANRKGKYAAKLNGCAANGVQSAACNPVAATQADTIKDMLRRAREVEQFCYAVLNKKQADNDCDVSYWLEYYARAAEQRRKIEKDFAGVMLSQGEVIPKETVEQELRQMAQAVKQGLLAIPNSVAPRLVGKTAVEMAEELRREVVDVLRHLSGAK